MVLRVFALIKDNDFDNFPYIIKGNFLSIQKRVVVLETYRVQDTYEVCCREQRYRAFHILLLVT